MLYILDQRLRAQNVLPDKASKGGSMGRALIRKIHSRIHRTLSGLPSPRSQAPLYAPGNEARPSPPPGFDLSQYAIGSPDYVCDT